MAKPSSYGKKKKSAKAQRYKLLGRFAENQRRRLTRHISEQPNDLVAQAALKGI